MSSLHSRSKPSPAGGNSCTSNRDRAWSLEVSTNKVSAIARKQSNFRRLSSFDPQVVKDMGQYNFADMMPTATSQQRSTLDGDARCRDMTSVRCCCVEHYVDDSASAMAMCRAASLLAQR